MNHTENPSQLVCEQCGYSTLQKRTLQWHIRQKHEIGKHIQCPHCDYHSITNNKMQIHIDHRHPDHGEMKFFCDQCGNGFIYICSLKNHEYQKCKSTKNYAEKRKIWGAKKKNDLSLPCDYCSKVLTTSYRLKRHYLVNHPNLPVKMENNKKYNCTDCDAVSYTHLTLPTNREV